MMATKQEPDIATLAVFDVESGQTIPVPLEDEGMNTIDWLVEKMENISQIVYTARDKKPSRVKVMYLSVGDLEIKPNKWKENTIEYYLLFGDPWFTKIKRLPNPSVHEMTHGNDAAVFTIVRNVEGTQNYLVSAPGPSSLPRFGYACGIDFVDLNTAAPIRREWSSKAPRWRLAGPGMCIEGKCENVECEAYHKMVIMSFGFVDFSLVDDAYQCECPICKQHVTPITCAFNNCKWKWNGRRFDDPKKRAKNFRQKEWKIADNAYHAFRPAQNEQTVKWQHLTVYARSLNEKTSTCVLCSIEGSHINIAGFEELKCGHHFHKKCLTRVSQLIRINSGESDSSACPECIQIDVHNEYIGDKRRIIDV